MKDPKTVKLEGGDEIYSENIVLATGKNTLQTSGEDIETHSKRVEKIGPGSIPIPLNIEHLSQCSENVLYSSEILNLRKLPESLCVIGGGVIGLELGNAWQMLGAILYSIPKSNTTVSFH